MSWKLALLICLVAILPVRARKVKHSFSVGKESKAKSEKSPRISGREIILADSLSIDSPSSDFGSTAVQLPIDSEKYALIDALKNCSFSGYDKEANSNVESFILMNPTDDTITGFCVKIDYLDMQGRMLHSRILSHPCHVPPDENRRIDVKSWDTQHTYYFHLGNEPLRVATPFQVKFTPLSFWVE